MAAGNWAIVMDRGTLPLILSVHEFLLNAASRGFRVNSRTQEFQQGLYIQMADLQGTEKEATGFGFEELGKDSKGWHPGKSRG